MLTYQSECDLKELLESVVSRSHSLLSLNSAKTHHFGLPSQLSLTTVFNSVSLYGTVAHIELTLTSWQRQQKEVMMKEKTSDRARDQTGTVDGVLKTT